MLAHIARLDKLAEGVATSRAAARFGEVTEAIAAQDDIAPLIEEPTEAEKVERARLLTVMGHAAENNDTAAMSDEPVEAFMCTFNDDPPEIYMMTESDAEAMEEEVVGMTVRALDEGEAAAAMADFRERYLVNDDEGPVQGDGTEKGFDPVNVVNFEEQEKEEEEEKQR